jgi:hypothetical protein
VPHTGGAYRDVAAAIIDPGGTHELYFVFLRQPGDAELCRVNWLCFRGPGATLTARAPRVTQLRARRPANSITVEFDTVMDAASLAAAGNYALTGASILSVQPAPDQRSVTLATTPLAAQQSYVLALAGLRDLAGDAMAAGTRLPFKTVSTVLALNAAGPAFTGGDGTSYLADQFFPGGSAYTTANGIAGTPDGAL